MVSAYYCHAMSTLLAYTRGSNGNTDCRHKHDTTLHEIRNAQASNPFFFRPEPHPQLLAPCVPPHSKGEAAMQLTPTWFPRGPAVRASKKTKSQKRSSLIYDDSRQVCHACAKPLRAECSAQSTHIRSVTSNTMAFAAIQSRSSGASRARDECHVFVLRIKGLRHTKTS